VGDSFGSSSFSSALSDFVVQLEGTCLSLTSPRVIETATGEVVSLEELGGTKVHGKKTGQIDRSAATPAEAYELVRSFLSFLPPRAGAPLPVTACGPVDDDASIASLVPARRTRAYDVRTVIRRLADDSMVLELKPAFSPNLVTALMRIGGVPAGVIANQPRQLAGSLTPDACLKAVRLMCLCDAFGLPLIFLADNPGFLVGTGAEYGRALARSQQLMQAHALLRVPACTVWLRKGFGLGFAVMGGGQPGVELSLAWPGAEIGFMDPDVAVNVLYSGRLAELPEAERPAFLAEQARNLATDFAPYGVASSMTIDEIIEPAATRRMLAGYLRSRILTSTGHATACPSCQRSDTGQGPLAHWPFW
jgi:acetyl-CoA carboxylase carboxyltransferase component